MNNESSPYSFNFVESSLSSDSSGRELRVEPLSGTVPPQDRCVYIILYTYCVLICRFVTLPF